MVKIKFVFLQLKKQYYEHLHFKIIIRFCTQHALLQLL